MVPAQVPTPIARWSQMAALGAAICNTLSQLWNVITSVSKPFRAWQPSPSDQAGSGEYPKTVTFSPRLPAEQPHQCLFLSNKSTSVKQLGR